MSIEKFNNLNKELKQKATTWEDINWRDVETDLAARQKGLVVAYNNSEHARLKLLQESLLRSFCGRAMAIRKVTQSKGSKTPGVDGKLWKTSKQRFEAIKNLKRIIFAKSGDYKANGVLRVWIPKRPNSKRPLGIPTLTDRAIQQLFVFILDPIVEEKSDLHSYGFRKYRSTNDAMQRLRHLLGPKNRPTWIYDADIKKCFDMISHEIILSEISKIIPSRRIKFVSQWLKAPIRESGTYIRPKKGTPQGGVISPLLSNIVLNGLEQQVRGSVLKSTSRPRENKLVGNWVIRYADDFLVTSRSRKQLTEENIPRIKTFLSTRGLIINEEKSKIINLESESFDFLGWNVSLKKRKRSFNDLNSTDNFVLIIAPTNASIKRIKTRLKEMFKYNNNIKALIGDLNPLLRGWTNYYRTSYHSQKVFQSLGHYVYEKTRSWLKKKHPRQTVGNINKKYVFSNSKRTWRFGINEKYVIFDPSQAQQIRFKNLQLGLNPYVHEDYYIQRTLILDADKFRAAVYSKYNKKCLLCGGSLYGTEPIELHHIIPERYGGKYTLLNIVPLHRLCHKNVTQRPENLNVEEKKN